MTKISPNSKVLPGWAVWLISLTALVVLFVPVSGAETQGNAPAGNPQNGKTVFMNTGCYRCHGTVGQGGPGGRLAPNTIPFGIFASFVRNGKRSNPNANVNWSGMPPYSEKFISNSELADIHAYLASIPPSAPVGSIPLLND